MAGRRLDLHEFALFGDAAILILFDKLKRFLNLRQPNHRLKLLRALL